MAARLHQRPGDARDGNGPERKPDELTREGACGTDRDEENDDQGKLERRKVPIRLVEAAQAEACFGPVADQQCDQSSRAAKPRGKEESTERPGVAPDRLVADASSTPV